MIPLILANLDMRANELFGTQALSMRTSNEMLINVLFTPKEKTFQYRVTIITTGGFKASKASRLRLEACQATNLVPRVGGHVNPTGLIVVPEELGWHIVSGGSCRRSSDGTS
jgi:hypothetical protein